MAPCFFFRGGSATGRRKGSLTVVGLEEFISVELEVKLDGVLAELVSAHQTLLRQVAHGGAGR